MSDEAVAALLRSEERLVAIEAAAGCGKTHQGASFARDWAIGNSTGRLLILTHTHAACDVFAERVKGVDSRVDIRTIDGLIAQVATAYHVGLGLPPDPASWAMRQEDDGFAKLAAKVARYLDFHPMIASAIARRYPMIICDEHQDCSTDQHRIVQSLSEAGASVRLFGDPMQRIYGKRSDSAIRDDWSRWERLKTAGRSLPLNIPHRWRRVAAGDLGDWVAQCRQTLQEGGQIDLTQALPEEVTIVRANNTSPTHSGFLLSRDDRAQLDVVKQSRDPLLVLAPTNALVSSLRAFWFRSLPIWEGHQRSALASFVNSIANAVGDASQVARAYLELVSAVGIGITMNSHGDRLMREITEGCANPARGSKPPNIQAIARLILDCPDHRGAANALKKTIEFASVRAAGFDSVKFDFWSELRDATKLGEFDCVRQGLDEITRMRTHARRQPPRKTISSIHKAKGLECDHVMLVNSQVSQLSGTLYSRNRLYVALSRARKSMTVVLPDVRETDLFKIG